MEIMPTLAENSFDACVCDPPYHLTSIVKRFGADNAAPAKPGKTGAYARSSAGFMGKRWDGGDVAFRPETWAAVYRVLKPGAHLIAFGGTRTYHRLACAIEDAGFEIRDMVSWLYGSGFPKSHDVSKGIDKSLGCERSKVRVENPRNPKATGGGRDGTEGATRPWIESAMARGFHEAVSDEAVSWQGWGTALKPACEPVVLARKPISEATVAANVLKWGTGAINVDACRVGTDGGCAGAGAGAVVFSDGLNGSFGKPVPGMGRWPANILTDGSDEVARLFPESESTRSVVKPGTVFGNGAGLPPHTGEYGFDDSGSAARFFYSAKADSDDRLGSKHPTVKPVDLMQYLSRLVTPPNGLVLDPFAGTGTTGEACWREGFRAVLIEREAEYQEDIRRRMRLAMSGPGERSREAVKAKTKDNPIDAGPLFGGSE